MLSDYSGWCHNRTVVLPSDDTRRQRLLFDLSVALVRRWRLLENVKASCCQRSLECLFFSLARTDAICLQIARCSEQRCTFDEGVS